MHNKKARLAAGLCVRCGANPISAKSKSSCEECLETMREDKRARAEENGSWAPDNRTKPRTDGNWIYA